MDVIFTGNVSKEGQRVVQAGRERGEENILITGLVILFVFNIVSTRVNGKNTNFQTTFQNVTWFSSHPFLTNGLFHNISESKSVSQIFAVVESSFVLVQSSLGCHYWSIPLQ